jgi:hypothetical protein
VTGVTRKHVDSLSGIGGASGFFEKLGTVDPDVVEAIEEMSAAIHSNRRSKGPLRL